MTTYIYSKTLVSLEKYSERKKKTHLEPKRRVLRVVWAHFCRCGRHCGCCGCGCGSGGCGCGCRCVVDVDVVDVVVVVDELAVSDEGKPTTNHVIC
jgi:hypothetical protein